MSFNRVNFQLLTIKKRPALTLISLELQGPKTLSLQRPTTTCAWIQTNILVQVKHNYLGLAIGGLSGLEPQSFLHMTYERFFGSNEMLLHCALSSLRSPQLMGLWLVASICF